MHQPLVEVGGSGSLEVFPEAGRAPPCVSALLGPDDPYCKSSVLSVCPVYGAVSLSHSTLSLLASSLYAQRSAKPHLPSASVVWGHCFHEEDAFGKDVILLRLLAKFPVKCSFSSFSCTTSIQGLSPFPAPQLGGTRCHVDVPGCPAPASISRGTWGFRMCLGNWLHQLGWICDLVCYLGLIYKLFRDDEIGIGFSGEAVVNKNISHLFIPCERRRKRV